MFFQPNFIVTGSRIVLIYSLIVTTAITCVGKNILNISISSSHLPPLTPHPQNRPAVDYGSQHIFLMNALIAKLNNATLFSLVLLQISFKFVNIILNL